MFLAVGMKLKQDGEIGLIQGIYSLCPTSRRPPEVSYKLEAHALPESASVRRLRAGLDSSSSGKWPYRKWHP